MKQFGFLTIILCCNLLAQAQKTITKTTGKAQRITHTLPNGTTVVLNALTTITYPVVFDNNNIVLTLNGEMYVPWENEQNRRLTVTLPAKQPILVSCLDCTVNLAAYAEDSIAKLAVLNGSATVLIGSTIKKAKRGQVAIMQNDLITIVTDTDYVQSDTSWMNRGLYFQDWPLRLIFTQLNRCRPDHLSLPRNSPVFDTKITIPCPYNSPIADILTSINGLEPNFTYEIRGNRVKVLPKKK